MEATVNESALGSINRMARGIDAVKSRVIAGGAAYGVVDEDNRAVIQTAVDGAVITLPLAADHKGLVITVQNTGAAGAAGVSISPNALDKIVGTVGAVQSDGVADKDWINTKATTMQGDYTTLISDGGTTWWIIGGVGVWASEA